MAENLIVVPMELQAMVVNGRPRNFQRWQMNYKALKIFNSPEPKPFKNDSDDFSIKEENQGVYLMWTLPKALRHGYQRTVGEDTKFPLVPNRWLVVRFSGQSDKRAAKAWVVESDRLDSTDGIKYMDPRTENPEEIMMGQKFPLESWNETSNSDLFLQAVAPGNLMFSAYQPVNKNVFSFHDDLSKQDILESDLSYMVVGWYSDRKCDLMDQLKEMLVEDVKDEKEILELLHWDLRKEPSESMYTIYHGLTLGVKWKKGRDIIPSSQPQDTDYLQTRVKVSVGNTDTEALIALLKHQDMGDKPLKKSELLLLKAFLYDSLDLMDEPNAEELIARVEIDACFASKAGGLIFECINKDSDEKNSPREQELLRILNNYQVELEEMYKRLNSMQRKLYELWWKQKCVQQYKEYSREPLNCKSKLFNEELDNTNGKSLVSQIDKLLTEIDNMQSKIYNCKEEANLELRQNGKYIVESSGQRYFQATDPTILIAGVNGGDVSEVIDVLYCRDMDEVITRFTYKNTDITIEEIMRTAPELDLSKLPWTLPDALKKLYGEFMLLDSLNSKSILENIYFSGDVKQIQDTEKNSAEDLKTFDIQKMPQLGLKTWVQPWLPLYLDWEVDWYPIPYYLDNKNLWGLNKNELSLNEALGHTPMPVAIQGRSLLTAKTNSTFKSRLLRFIANNPDESQNIEDLLKQIEKWDLLSQELAGLNVQISMRDTSATLMPDNNTILFPSGRTMADLIGDQHHYAPKPGALQYISENPTTWIDPYNQDLDYADTKLAENNSSAAADITNTVQKSTFSGIRCGQFIFKKITIVDRFGQTAEVVSGQSSQTFHPVIADSLKPEYPVLDVETSRLIQMAPRLLQDSRLKSEWVSNVNDSITIKNGMDDTPVCGWILLDYLDRELAVYGPTGKCLGNIFVGKDKYEEDVVCWGPSLEMGGNADNDLTKHNHLNMFYNELREKGKNAYNNLLEVIDETLCMVSPDLKQNLKTSALFSRPLALVRMKLKLELQEEALNDPAWEYTFSQNIVAFMENDFSVKPGDFKDGLIGYFINNNYTEFFTVLEPQNYENKSNYVKRIEPHNCIRLSFQPGSEVLLTLLIDPSLNLHIQTGILPDKTLIIPERFTTEALNNMEITVRNDSCLTMIETLQDGSSKQILIPKPAGLNEGCSWLERMKDAWTEMNISTTSQEAYLGDELPVIRDGFLRIKR